MISKGLMWALAGIILISFCFSGVTAAPVAAFSGTPPLSGTAPFTVAFMDESTGDPTGWAWFFGDENYTAPWTQMTASAGWTARQAQSSVAMLDGSIVLIGGFDSSPTNDTWRSTDNGTTWTQMTASAGWSARTLPSSVVMPDGSIVLMGGIDSSPTNDTWRSTDNGTTWTQMTASAGWSARGSASSVVLPDGSIVLMGGHDFSDQKNDTWRSFDNGATWTQMTASAGWSTRTLPCSMAMPDGSIVLLGGYDGPIVNNDTWRSTDNGATWTQMTASAGWSAREFTSCVAMPDGSIVMMGGEDSGGYKNDTWRSKDNGATWTQIHTSAGWSARLRHSSLSMPDGSIMLLGGWDDFGAKNDVWRLIPAGSSGQNPSHTYTTPGTYSVALQAYNKGGYNSTRKTGYITVASQGWDGTTCTVITNPGTYQVLGDIQGSPGISCINIQSSDVMIEGNGHTLNGTTGNENGVYASASPVRISNVTVKNLTISNWGMGIIYENVTGGAIDNITVLTSETQGITLGTSSSVALKNVNASLNWVGIAVIEGSDDNTLTHVTASRNDAVGLWFYAARNNTVMSGTFDNNNGPGVSLDGRSNNNTLFGNTANFNSHGIFIEANGNGFPSTYPIGPSDNNTITNNSARNNTESGIILFESANNNHITGNTFTNNRIGVHFNATAGAISGNIISNNNASSNSYHGIVFSNATGNTLTANNASSNGNNGIFLFNKSRGNFLSDNIATFNGIDGFAVRYSRYNNLTHNKALNNVHIGINLDRAENITVFNNDVSENDHGMLLYYASNNTIINNSISANNEGFRILIDGNNSITNNTVTVNDLGIWVNSSHNDFFNNYFDNTNNAVDGSTTGNSWNTPRTEGTNIIGGSWLGGNFWSDYAGVDTDGDGIGNTLVPYTAGGNITAGGDWLPLTNNPPPASLPENGRIAFFSDRNGIDEIFVMNADGSELINFSIGSSPVWSPDGSKIAYIDTGDIYVMDADGKNAKNLTLQNYRFGASEPSWSPDGTKIAFKARKLLSSTRSIYVMAADGNNPIELISSGGVGSPSWSPNGTKIAFIISNEFTRNVSIMNTDGSEVTIIAYGSSPYWSPDGTKIAYIDYSNGLTNGMITIMNPDGSGKTNTGALGSSPVWSPDGTRIAFINSTDGMISFMNPDGSGKTNTGALGSSPVWSPDGTKIAFVSGPDIFIMNADENGQLQLTHEGNNYEPEWGPKKQNTPQVRPVLELYLDENGGTTAIDSSGNGLNGTILGSPAWVDGISGKGLKLDGVNDYVDLGNSAVINPSGNLTLEAWVKPSDITQNQRIIDKFDYSGYSLLLNPGGNAEHRPTILFQLTTSNGLIQHDAGEVLNGEWQHIAAVYDGSKMYIYWNGILQGTPAPQSGSIQNTAGNLSIGRNAATDIEYFNGTIDEVVIYSQALSADDILAHYQAHEANITRITVADFTANVTFGTAPLTVKFTDLSTGIPVPTAVNLSFGDGNWTNSTGSWVHTYTYEGTFFPVIYAWNGITSDSGTNATISVNVTPGLDPGLAEAYNIVLENVSILDGTSTGKLVSASPEKFTEGEKSVDVWGGKPAVDLPEQAGWLIFIDDYPGANWEHPCRYVFVGDDGIITVIEAMSPPADIDLDQIAGGISDPWGDANSVTSPSANPGGGLGLLNLGAACNGPDCSHNYALLISGGFNTSQNHIRYWNDISFMYQTLNQTYGYPTDHIIVLMSDGTSSVVDRHNATAATGAIKTDNSPVNLDLKYGSIDVNGDARKATVTSTLASLNSKSPSADSLFIFTTSHGGWDGVKNSNNSLLYLWQQEYISDTDFVAALPTAPKNITMVMEQCYSGGFVDNFIDKYSGSQKRVIITAANASEPSWGNGFSNAWTSAVAMIDENRGLNLKADTTPVDGKISMWEAWNYTLKYDPSASPSLPNHEHPQYSAKNPANAGSTQYLSTCPSTTRSVRVTKPNAVEVPWNINSPREITWTETALLSGQVNISLWKGTTTKTLQRYIAQVPASQGYYVWTVPSLTAGSDYWINISSVSTPVVYNSSPNFAITTAGSLGTIKVNSTPPGSTAYVDGVQKGTTNATITGITPGDHNVSVMKTGYYGAWSWVTVKSGSTFQVNYTLDTVAANDCPPFGKMRVRSTPQDSKIIIDGVYTGLRTDSETEIAPGTHTVSVMSDGYITPDPQDVTIVAPECGDPNREERTAIVDFELTPVSNIAPVVYAGPDGTIYAGSVFGSDGFFTDPNEDIWTASVNYGDGSGSQPLGLNGKEFALSHTYAANGLYTVTVSVMDNAGGAGIGTANVTVTTPVPVLPLPGFTNPPTDPDSDGLYEDLNGNTRKDFNDVVVMFNQMQWIAVNEPVNAFDFNGNSRIDFNDIVKLFGEI